MAASVEKDARVEGSKLQSRRTLVEHLVLAVAGHDDGARRDARHRRDRERRSSSRDTRLAEHRRGGREGSREGGEEAGKDNEAEHDWLIDCASSDSSARWQAGGRHNLVRERWIGLATADSDSLHG